MTIEKPFLTASRVAPAVGFTLKALRNLLDRGRFEPESETETGRLEFSAHDVAVLSIARPLINFGVPADLALAMAKDALAKRKATKHIALDAPGAFSIRLMSTYLRVTKRDEGWFYDVTQDADSAQSAFIQVHCGMVVRDAFRKIGLVKEL